MGANFRKISFVVLLVLSGCRVGPDYRTPAIHMPEAFVEDRGEGEENLATWWRQFDDEELNSLVDEALCHNFDLRTALENIEEKRALYRLKSADLFPEIDAVGDVNRSRLSQSLFQSPFAGTEHVNFFELGAEAIWELDFWGKLRRSKEAAFYDLQASVEAMRAAQVLVVSDVATTYVSVRLFAKLVALSREKVSLLHRLVALAEDRAGSGLSSEIVVEEQKEALERARRTLVERQTELKAAIYSLAVLLGKQPEEMGDKWERVSPLPEAMGRLFGVMPSSLLQRRPDLREAERKLAAETALIGARVAELFPQFSLLGSFTFASNESSDWFSSASRAWTIGPKMRFPLLDFGRIRAKISAQKVRARSAMLEYEQAILNALREVEEGFVGYFNQEKELFLTSGELKAVRSEERLKVDRYQSGLESAFESLETGVRRVGVEEELSQQQARVAKRLIVVYKTLGGGW